MTFFLLLISYFKLCSKRITQLIGNLQGAILATQIMLNLGFWLIFAKDGNMKDHKKIINLVIYRHLCPMILIALDFFNNHEKYHFYSTYVSMKLFLAYLVFVAVYQKKTNTTIYPHMLTDLKCSLFLFSLLTLIYF